MHALYSGPIDALVATDPTPWLVSSYIAAENFLLTSTVGDPARNNAIRFLNPGLVPERVNEHEVLIGKTSAAPPAQVEVAQWADPGGVVISIRRSTNRANSLPSLREIVRRTRRLTRPEWEALVNSARYCSAALALVGAGSSSSGRAGPTGTSPTSLQTGAPQP